jgi:hypothetical protein
MTRARWARPFTLLLVAVLAIAATAETRARASSPPKLAPGPWKMIAHGQASGRHADVVISRDWSHNDADVGPRYPPSTPFPRRMGFIVTETPSQRVKVRWTAYCYPNREHSYDTDGVIVRSGRIVSYPNLYAGRVECDLYVDAQLTSIGTVRAAIYAY